MNAGSSVGRGSACNERRSVAEPRRWAVVQGSDIIGGYAVLFSTMALGAAVRYRDRARLRELDEAKLAARERLPPRPAGPSSSSRVGISRVAWQVR